MAEKIKIEDTLKNGATVLQVRADGHGGEVVLALYSGSEFVTWVASYGPDSPETFWGHYFDSDLPAALADFQDR